jgi:hypothetical protein
MTLLKIKHSRRIVVILAVVAAIIGGLLLQYRCPQGGIAFTRARRDFHRLKNRTAIPEATDFDRNVTLRALLQPGDDSSRWSTSHAATLEGYVVSIAKGPMELVNCYAPCNRDTHIHIGLRSDSPPREQIILEVTPRMEAWATSLGLDWSEVNLKATLMGHWCRFEGWLFFDSYHATESENTAPGANDNWRCSAWEIHPITKLEVIK